MPPARWAYLYVKSRLGRRRRLGDSGRDFPEGETRSIPGPALIFPAPTGIRAALAFLPDVFSADSAALCVSSTSQTLSMLSECTKTPQPSSYRLRALLAVVFFALGAILLFVRFRLAVATDQLHKEIRELTYKVRQLEDEQTMPAMVLERYRNSICYLSGTYEVRFNSRASVVHAEFSGTGFVVTNGLVATARHVAEPWYRDKEDAALLRQGAKARLEKMLAFCPDLSRPVNVRPAAVSAQEDVAVLRIEDSDVVSELRPVPLTDRSPNPGELVSVVAYPMGVFGMLAKSPPPVYDRLVFRHHNQLPAQLASLSLIRPSATCGHLGDVVGNTLIYDAPTAPGASGGPIFNSHGVVIGVNAAYVNGFSGETLGVSISTLLPLIATATKH